MLRLSWTQPEDLLPHALVAAELDGRRGRRHPRALGGRGRRADRSGERRDADPGDAGAAAARPRAARRGRRATRPRRRWSPPSPMTSTTILALAPGMASPAPLGGSGGRAARRPRARRVAGPRIRMPARQAGGEDLRATASVPSRGRPATGRSARYFTEVGLDPEIAGAVSLEPSQPARRASSRTSTACRRTTTSTFR